MSSLAPLTHHEIMQLLGPFSRRGWHVDLTATDRGARRLEFRALEHAAEAGRLPPCREHLSLELDRADQFRLIRRLATDHGLDATLALEGTDVEVLLAALERQPLASQFTLDDGVLIGWQQQLVLPAILAAIPAGRPPAPHLRAAEARAAGIALRLRMSRVASVPADVVVECEPVAAWQLPDDLLAVLGWSWGAHPRRTATGWTTTLLLRGRPEARSARGMDEFQRAVRHVARTLVEPPAAFHARCAWARWGVACRRGLPLLSAAVLLIGALLLQRLPMAAGSTLRMLVFNAPPLLLVVAFSLRELPRIQLPRWPRPSRLSGWRLP